MRRICLVVHRFGKEIVGGSEQLARCYAHLLKDDCAVHVVTTCAADYLTWKNEFPEGVSQEDGIYVHRFAVDFERTLYWHQLHYSLLLRHIAPGAPEQWPTLWFEDSKKDAFRRAVANLPRAVQEEFVRCQGPYSSSLLRFLENEKDNFDVYVFFTYLYPTTYYGSQVVPRGKRILVPTLHDEPHARLPLFREMVEDFDKLIFLTPGERSIAERIWQPSVPGELVGLPVELTSQNGGIAESIPECPYLLYCGRIESAKGASALFQQFIRYKAEHSSELKLVLTGHAAERIPDHPDILFLGYVDESRKFSLMRGAKVFVHPSALESFSIVLLEAFLSGTPALVNANSVVLAEHCRAANAGLEYRNYDEFAECLSQLLSNSEIRKALGDNGRRYAQQNYSSEVITTKLKALLEHRDWECRSQAANV